MKKIKIGDHRKRFLSSVLPVVMIMTLMITLLPSGRTYAIDETGMIPTHEISYDDDALKADISFHIGSIDTDRYEIKQLISMTEGSILYDADRGTADLIYEADKNGNYPFKVIYSEKNNVQAVAENTEMSEPDPDSGEVINSSEEDMAVPEIKEKTFDISVEDIKDQAEGSNKAAAEKDPVQDISGTEKKKEDQKLLKGDSLNRERMSNANSSSARIDTSSFRLLTFSTYRFIAKNGYWNSITTNVSSLNGNGVGGRTFAVAGDTIETNVQFFFTEKPPEAGQTNIKFGRMKIGDREVELDTNHKGMFMTGPDSNIEFNLSDLKAAGETVRWNANQNYISMHIYVKVPDDFISTADNSKLSIEAYADGNLLGDIMSDRNLVASRPIASSNGSQIDDVYISPAELTDAERMSLLFDGITVTPYGGQEISLSDLFTAGSASQSTWTYSDLISGGLNDGLGTVIKAELFDNTGRSVTAHDLNSTDDYNRLLAVPYYLKITVDETRYSRFMASDTFDSDTEVVRRIWFCDNFSKATDASGNTLFGLGKIDEYVINGLDLKDYRNTTRLASELLDGIDTGCYSSNLRVDDTGNIAGDYSTVLEDEVNMAVSIDFNGFTLNSTGGEYDVYALLKDDGSGLEVRLPIRIHLSSTYPIEYLEIPKDIQLDRDGGIDQRHAGKKETIKLIAAGVNSGKTFSLRVSKNFILKHDDGDAQYTGTVHRENGALITSMTDDTIWLADLNKNAAETTIWLNIDKYDATKKGVYKGKITFSVNYWNTTP